MIVVSDTSPITNLAAIDRVDLLQHVKLRNQVFTDNLVSELFPTTYQ